MPGGVDVNTDYEMVIEDSGTSARFWVQNAANPSIKTDVLTFDTTGYSRFGDTDVVNPRGVAGIDDVTIIPEPGSITLLLCGLLCLAFVAWRKRRSR